MTYTSPETIHGFVAQVHEGMGDNQPIVQEVTAFKMAGQDGPTRPANWGPEMDLFCIMDLTQNGYAAAVRRSEIYPDFHQAAGAAQRQIQTKKDYWIGLEARLQEQWAHDWERRKAEGE